MNSRIRKTREEREVELTFDDGDIPDDIFPEQQRVQSSFGLSFISKDSAQLAISVNFATYSAEKIEINGREQVVYKRQQHSFSSNVSVDMAAEAVGKRLEVPKSSLHF